MSSSSRWIVPLCLAWLAVLYVVMNLNGSGVYYSQAQLLSLATSAIDSGNEASSTLSSPWQSPPASPKTIMPPLSHPDSISCDAVQQNVEQGLWPDPNEGEYYIRRVVDAPHFFASVHSREYDPLRFTNIYQQGRYYEVQVIDRFHRILENAPKPSIVLDVGGNIGFYTLLSASHGHIVHTFEINPANLIRMCESLSLNRWADNGRVHIYQRAISNEPGQQLQVKIPRNPGAAHLQPMQVDQTTPASTETTIRSAVATTMTLDGLAHDQGWLTSGKTGLSIPLLKMDVEGAEPHVIAGATELLASGIVKNVLTEFRRPNEPDSQQALATLLQSGYRIVNDDNKASVRRLDMTETLAYLKAVEERLTQRKLVYADLWFQLDETA